MLKQSRLRLTVTPLPGESNAEFNFRSGNFKKHIAAPEPQHIPPEKLLTDLLRRHIRRIIADVTECPPASLSAHLARLDDWTNLAEFCTRHFLAETPECRLSGKQLLYPATIADWIAVAEITRREHRAPSFVNDRDDKLERIIGRLDLLAGLILKDTGLTSYLSSAERSDA